MQRLRERLGALARLRVPVLLCGESGTGRTHLARALHEMSGRSPQELVALSRIDESKPFGLLKARKCLLVRNIEGFSRADQSRFSELLRRAESGHPEAPKRLLATTSRSMPALRHSGEFDPDLAHQLGRFVLEVPALRERREDIAPLTVALVERTALRLRGATLPITPGAVRLLAMQSFPGNVRELAECVEKLVAFCPEERITRAQVRSLLDETPRGVLSSRRLQVQQQRDELAALIEQTGGNLAEVARRLDMSRGGVIYRAQKFGLLPRRA